MNKLINTILNYTKEAVKKTSLRLYFNDEEIEHRFKKNIQSIHLEEVLNFEIPKIVDGTLVINPRLLNNNNQEYVKEVLTSFGLYSIISDCKKYNPVNDMIATYFSALYVRDDDYRVISSLKEGHYSFLNHNLIYNSQISIFHELIGEETIAKLVSKIDSKHSFYDNLYELIQYMSVKNGFSKRDFHKLENLMEKACQECDKILHISNMNTLVRKAYPIFNKITKRFSNEHSFNEFFQFYERLLSSKFNYKNIKKMYNLDLSDINVSQEELLGLKRILNMLNNDIDFSIDNYYDLCLRCAEYVNLNSCLLSSLIQKVNNKQHLIDNLLLIKFVLPLSDKYGISNEEMVNVQNILSNVDNEDIKTKIKDNSLL